MHGLSVFWKHHTISFCNVFKNNADLQMLGAASKPTAAVFKTLALTCCIP